jgi:hypothetical protein
MKGFKAKGSIKDKTAKKDSEKTPRTRKDTYYRDLDNDIIQEKGDLLLRNTFSGLHQLWVDTHWVVRDQQDQKDKGVDFEYELSSKSTRETLLLFKIQNKATEGGLKVLKTTVNKGKISFPIEIRHVHYYRHELNVPLIFTVCDLNEQKVYWHAIQLDEEIDERANAAYVNGQESTTIYINPENVLTGDTVRKLLAQLNDSRNEQHERLNEKPLHDLFQESEVPVVDPTKHILDQLYDFFQAYQNNFRYIPINNLKDYYPFKVAENFRPHYEDFKLSTDNEKLLSLVQNLQFNDHKTVTIKDEQFFEGVTDPIAKAEYVFKALSANLVFNIMDKKSVKSVHTHLYPQPDIPKLMEQYETLNYDGLLTELNKDSEEIKDKMAKAYLCYLIGNFYQSAQLYEQAGEKAKKRGLQDICFLCQFNLSKLSRFLRNRFERSDDEKNKQIEKWDAIEIAKQVKKLKTPHKQFLSTLSDNSFYRDIRDKIQEQAEKIRVHYQSQLRGGWSSQKNRWDLVATFADLDQLLDQDCLVYNRFLEFSKVFEPFIGSLFSLHAMSEEQPGKLGAFDDWMLHRIIFHAKPDMIVQQFNRHYLKSIKYSKGNGPDRFEVLVNNILTIPANFKTRVESQCENVFDDFWRDYNRHFANIMVLLGLLELDDPFVNASAEKVIAFLDKEDMIYPMHYTQVELFFEQKRKQLSSINKAKLLELTLKNHKCHSKDWFDMLFGVLNIDKKGYVFPEAVFDQLLSSFDGECPVCKQHHDGEILPTLRKVVIKQEHKDRVIALIEAKLVTAFDDDLVYHSVIMDALESRPEWRESFIELATPRPDRISFKSDFGGKADKHIYLLDMLINMGFKEGWDFKDKAFDRFRKLHDYYAWLLDMEHFDYSKFDPRWLKDYATYYYFREFRKHEVIKEKLTEYLNDKRDLQLERLYFDLYKPYDEDEK